MYRLDHLKLKNILINVFQNIGLCSSSINHVVESMIETSLRGIDSHGINLFPHYYRAVKSGRVNSKPQFEITSQNSSTAIINANHAFGHHSGSKAIEIAIKLAENSGIGAVSVNNSTHFGAAGYFALQASRKNFLAFSFTNADSLVRVTNTKESYFGTNPICFTAPMEGEEPLCLDMATSIVSWNKILNARIENSNLEKGLAVDIKGKSCIDPNQAAMLEAIGTYKGYGLGMMVEILCGMISNGPIGREILPMFTSPIEEKRKISHFFIVIDLGSFISVKSFKMRLKNMADEIRSLGDNIFIPGDPEKVEFKDRIVSGIPIEKAKYEEFVKINKDFETTIVS